MSPAAVPRALFFSLLRWMYYCVHEKDRLLSLWRVAILKCLELWYRFSLSLSTTTSFLPFSLSPSLSPFLVIYLSFPPAAKRGRYRPASWAPHDSDSANLAYRHSAFYSRATTPLCTGPRTIILPHSPQASSLFPFRFYVTGTRRRGGGGGCSDDGLAANYIIAKYVCFIIVPSPNG